jgi:hypothetical protein
MRLSDSIAMGDFVIPRGDGRTWLSGYQGGGPPTCGCAVGRAYLANGGRMEAYRMEASFIEMWPWLTLSKLGDISLKFTRVVRGEMTIEQLADYVRSIEPDEDDTVQKMDEVEQVREAVTA